MSPTARAIIERTKESPARDVLRYDPQITAFDTDINKLLLDGKRIDARVEQAITAGDFELTIAGASTVNLTLRDDARELLRSGLFEESSRIEIDDYGFKMAKVNKVGSDFALTFEAEAVYWMRQYSKPRKAFRDKVTRAEFAKMLTDEVKEIDIKFVSPDLHREVPIKGSGKSSANRRKVDKEDRRERREPGINGDNLSQGDPGKLTVKGKPITRAQISVAEEMLDEAERLNAPDKARVALIAAGIVESLLNRTARGGNTSFGALQVRVDLHGQRVASSVRLSTNVFLTKGFTGAGGAIALARARPGWSAGQIAQAVQGSALPLEYDKRRAEAERIVGMYAGDGGLGSAGDSRTVTKRYAFTRGSGGKRENTWACLERLADEVNWRRFVLGRRCYFISDRQLMRSETRAVISEDDEGINWIDFDHDVGKRIATCTVSCRASRWEVPPGAIVEIEKLGPANGRWLVETFKRSFFSPDATVTLKRPEPALREPAPETRQVNRRNGGSGGGAGGGDAARFVRWAEGTVGVVEGDGRHRKWAADVGVFDPWCSVYIAYGIKYILGLSWPPNPAYSGAWLQWSDGRRVSVNDIKPGDLVIYDWGDGGITDHVAIYVGGNMTIGGNESDAVRRTSFSGRRGSIVGIVRPRYKK